MGYKFWDKKEDIYSPGSDSKSGKSHWSANEYIADMAGWAGLSNAKVVISDGDINGEVFMSFTRLKSDAERMGFVVPEVATDEEVLRAISEWEERVALERRIAAIEAKKIPTTEERIAAAMEFQNLMLM